MIQPSQIDRIWSERYVDVYNNTGSQLNQYKFVKAIGDYATKKIPSVGLVNDYAVYPTALLLDNLPNGQATDLQLTTIRALERGRVQILGFNTTLATPGVTKVFCDNTGSLTLTPTPFLVGVVLEAQVDGVINLMLSNSGTFETATATYRQSFQNSHLLAGVLTVTHNLNLQYCAIQVFDNLNRLVTPDEIILVNDWTAQVDLTSFGVITGSWNVVVIGTGTGILAAPSTILSGLAAPSPLIGNDGDFYINTSVYDIYGPKNLGSWGSATSLIATVPDATPTVKGKIKLAGDLGGTADLPTVPGIELNAVISRYRRGYNNTGSSIPKCKFVSPDGNMFSNYPTVQVADLTKPCLGVLEAALPNGSGAKVLYYGLFQFDPGIVDTTLVPLNTPVYVDASGNLTLSYTTIIAGHTASQGTSPWILLNVKYNPERYIEFTLTAVTSQTFSHNFNRFSQVTVTNSLGEDITAGVIITHDPNKLDVTLTSNVPITGKLICSCD